MRPSSCKAKGRIFQQEVAASIVSAFNLPESDVKSLPMGSQGEDIWLSDRARRCIPMAIECKKQEKLNIHAAFKQAIQHWEKLKDPSIFPLLVHSKNRSETLCTLRFDDLLKILVSALRANSHDSGG